MLSIQRCAHNLLNTENFLVLRCIVVQISVASQKSVFAVW